MSEDATPLRPARFYCAMHGATNQVIGVAGCTYCLACVDDIARTHLNEVLRMDPPDFLMGDPR